MITVYIGYDTREPISFHVCSNSIIRHSTQPAAIVPLSLSMLPYTETHTDSSNQFGYSRFLVPFLQEFKGWALFIDGDMVVRDDITNLLAHTDDTKAVVVVKHEYTTLSLTKYLGAKNENYPRKNWSSVILWNCEHPDNRMLTPEFIQNATGEFLHQFQWVDVDNIGELPVEWNWLADEFGTNENAKLIHYTLGTPCFNDYKNSPMSEHWYTELQLTTYYEQQT